MYIQGKSPFSLRFSSCSNRRPLKFVYLKYKKSVISKKTLILDNEINNLINNGNYKLEKSIFGKNKIYGWFVESREVSKDLYESLTIERNIEKLQKFNLKSIFTCDLDLINFNPDFFKYSPNGSNLPWVPLHEYGLYEKNKNISMVCSQSNNTYGHKLRLGVAEEIKDRIDLFGGACGSPKIGEKLEGYVEDLYTWRSKLPALKEYRFSVVFENANYDKYYTEKITDCFASGTIPVYWGTRKIAEDFDARGIIFWDDLNDISELNEDLYDKMYPYVVINFEKVKKLQSADDQIFKLMEKGY